MLILWIPLVLIVMYIILHAVFVFLWPKGIHVELDFKQRKVTEGQEAVLLETLKNNKFLPLPVIRMQFKLDRGLQILENENVTVSDTVNVVEYFSVFGWEQLVRTQRVLARKRGYYRIRTSGVAVPELFSLREGYLEFTHDTELVVCPGIIETEDLAVVCEQLIGEMLSRRRIFEDVFTFRGIREYVPTDPISSINWKASAKSSGYMVNLRDYTAGQEVRILLDLDNTKERFITDIFEGSIRIAATVAGSFIDDHIMTSLVTNGRDVLTGQEAGVEAGSSAEHTGTIGEALARIDLGMERAPFAQRIYEELLDPSGENVAYLLISSDTGDVKTAAASELGVRRGGIYWVCPVTEDLPEKRFIPDGIEFYEVRV